MTDLPFSKAKQLRVENAMGQTRTQERRALKEKILETWSKVVRKLDGYRCQWGECGSRKDVQAHHVVPRSLCNNRGFYDRDNGMTLCQECHIHRVKLHPKEYHAARDAYLKRSGRPSYDELRQRYKRTGMQLEISEMEILHLKLKHDLKNLGA